MTIENGTVILLTYVLVSMGMIIAFLLAAFMIGWFIGRLRQHRREQRGEEYPTGRRSRAGQGRGSRCAKERGWCMRPGKHGTALGYNDFMREDRGQGLVGIPHGSLTLYNCLLPFIS